MAEEAKNTDIEIIEDNELKNRAVWYHEYNMLINRMSYQRELLKRQENDFADTGKRIPIKEYCKVDGKKYEDYVAELKKIAMRNGDDIVTVNTLKRGEAIFTPHDADLVARLIDKVPVMHSMLDTAKYMGSTASTPTQMNQNISQQFGDLHIEIDHVEDYNDLVTKMRDDPKFEKFIQSMTTDRLVGKSKLGKYKF